MLIYMTAELIAAVERKSFAEVARGWLTGTLDEVIPRLAGDLRARPVVRAELVSPLGTVDIRQPWGEPGHVLGHVGITRRSPIGGGSVLYSQRTWEHMLAALEDYPFAVWLDITRLNERGFPLHRSRPLTAVLNVRRDRIAPGLARLSFRVSADETGWPDAPALQDRWARFVKRQAAVIRACWGSMTDDIGDIDTAVERVTASSRRSPNLASPREVLRGYSWVTVVAAELAERLGGAAALAATGAFCEVEKLPDGGLWLRATPAINAFTGEAVEQVFRALAPVLLNGVATFEAGATYRLVEGVDAADFRQPN